MESVDSYLSLCHTKIKRVLVNLEDAKKIIDQEVVAIRNIPITDAILRAIDCLYTAVHIKGGKVVVSGVGKAGEIGANIATTFCSTGTPAAFLHPLDAVHGNIGVIQDNDVMIVLTNSGKTREVLELIPIARNLSPDLPIISITGNVSSPIASCSDIILSTGLPQEVCSLGLTPTTSTTVMTILGDILIVLLMQRIGFTRADYGKRHHGGYLGSLANNREY